MAKRELTPTQIKVLIKKAGFKSKAEFARELNISELSVNNWGNANPVPKWLFKVLEWAKKAKEYDKEHEND